MNDQFLENRNLFSDRYLDSEFLADVASLAPESRSAYQALVELRRTSRPERFGSGRELHLREEYLDKVLDVLGWARSSEGRIPGDGNPDYTLFLHQAEKDAALSKLGSLDYFRDAVCLCEAKSWEAELRRTDSVTRSARGQVYGYLEETHVNWGIVTNGRDWTIVWKGYTRSQQRDLTINLDELLNDGEWSPQFSYFFGLFSRIGFEHGLPQLAIDKSGTSGEAVGRSLKDNVFSALLELGRAIYLTDVPRYSSPADLRTLKADCLTFLYRLLFINYAESRKLLPMRDSDLYRRSYSLLRVKEAIRGLAPRMSGEEYAAVDSHSFELHRNVKRLFRAIDTGNPLAQIPPYNGGLFRSTEHPVLESIEIDDNSMARVVDLLSRVKSDPERFLDYSYLGVRELGSIYEGLLEYKFEIDSSGEAPRVTLVGSRSDRQASGSFYTPDEIVRCVVREAVGPVVVDRLARAEKEGGDPRAAILGIKVLDPAMGSGHFLVAVTEFLAEKLLLVDESSNPEERTLSDESGEIEAEAKRQVATHCIYGVDSNPMAVELAKVSIWLTTFSRGHPLTFLDHRLKYGNSLVGSWLRDVPWHPRKRPKHFAAPITLPEGLVGEQLRVLGEIESGLEDSVGSVKRKEEAYRQLLTSRGYLQVSSLATLHSGLLLAGLASPEVAKAYGQAAVHLGDATTPSPSDSDWTRSALRAASSHSVFTWELEFPDVLLSPDRAGLVGFDVVLGNPPYVPPEEADKEERSYLMKNPAYEHLAGRFDLSIPFIERSLDLIRQGGRFGMIVTSSVPTTDYGERIRDWIFTDHTLESVADFGDHHVFPGVAVRTCILIIRKSKADESHEVRVSLPTDVLVLGQLQRPIAQTILGSLHGRAIRASLDPDTLSLKDRIDSRSIPLGRICYCITGVVAHDSVTHESKDRLIADVRRNEWYRPYVEAKDTEGRYAWIAPKRFIEYRPELRGHMHRPKFRELFTSTKIFIQGISGTGLIATLDTEGTLTNHSMLCCVKAEDILKVEGRRNLSKAELRALNPDPRYDLRFVLAVLSGKLAGFYFSNYLWSGGGVTPDLVNLIPIPRLEFSHGDPAGLTRLLRLDLAHADSDPIATALAELPERVRAQVAHDCVCVAVDKTISNNRSAQTERESFLGWLSREVGAGVLDLPGKTEFEHYEGTPPERLLELLRKNRRKLKVDPATREFQDRVLTEYSHSKAKITPLLEENTRLDRLLDSVMFWLYGLSRDEMRIVEGSVQRMDRIDS